MFAKKDTGAKAGHTLNSLESIGQERVTQEEKKSILRSARAMAEEIALDSHRADALSCGLAKAAPPIDAARDRLSLTTRSPTLISILRMRGKKENEYDNGPAGAEEFFRSVAAMWNVYIQTRFAGVASPSHIMLQPGDVPILMSMFKTCRIAMNGLHLDSYDDGANYLVLAGDVARRRRVAAGSLSGRIGAMDRIRDLIEKENQVAAKTELRPADPEMERHMEKNLASHDASLASLSPKPAPEVGMIFTTGGRFPEEWQIESLRDNPPGSFMAFRTSNPIASRTMFLPSQIHRVISRPSAQQERKD